MPATRTPARHSRQSPFPSASPPEKHLHPVDPNDVINLSSSGDERPPITKIRKHAKPLSSRSKPKPRIPAGEVIEISSEDEDETPSPASIIADLQRKLKSFKETTARYKKDYEEACRELTEAKEELQLLKAAPPQGKGKVILDETQLEDNLNCEICTMRLWTPYILPDCGHTFCQSCLQDWFGTTLAQFMGNNPNYNVNRPNPYAQHLVGILADPHSLRQPRIAHQINAYMPPQPQYTCPTCREPVKSRPVEDFALKSLVRVIAAATGESSPSKNNRGKGKKTVANDPWGGFFPKYKP